VHFYYHQPNNSPIVLIKLETDLKLPHAPPNTGVTKAGVDQPTVPISIAAINTTDDTHAKASKAIKASLLKSISRLVLPTHLTFGQSANSSQDLLLEVRKNDIGLKQLLLLVNVVRRSIDKDDGSNNWMSVGGIKFLSQGTLHDLM